MHPGRGRALAQGRGWTKAVSPLSHQPLEAQRPRGPVRPWHQSLGDGHCPRCLHGPSHRLSFHNTRQPPDPFVQRLLHAQSCPTLWGPPMDCARQAPLSMGFSRQEYWSGLSFPSPGIFPTQGSNPVSCLAGGFFTV